jgi:hypothetical protein
MLGALTPTYLPGSHSVGRLVNLIRLFVRSIPVPLQLGGLLLMLGASFTEGLGMSLLGPLLGLLDDRATSAGSARDAVTSLLDAFGLRPSLPLVLGMFVGAVPCRVAFVRKRDMVVFDLQHGFIKGVWRRLYRTGEAAEWAFIAKERLSHLVKVLGEWG